MHPAEQEYIRKTPGSATIQASARLVFPSGVTHDSRHITPHGLYVRNASGAEKTDVDGNRYVDYFGGHGALLLGHTHPEVGQAIHAALDRGTHFAAGHTAEITWAERIIRMVPSAELVRFTASGTEATQLALRLARAFTGRNIVLRFHRHFHGWMDDMTTGYNSHFEGGTPTGVPPNLDANLILAAQNDSDGLAGLMARFGGEIAAVLIEPMGAGTGRLPIDPSFVRRLREHCTTHGIVLIFDEVITGFRVAPGGAQESLGITPDMTALAKIAAGGLPGGAVCGRSDILGELDFDRSGRANAQKVYHPGTFNANPVSAAAGVATLDIIRRDNACDAAATYAGALRAALNDLFATRGVPWAVHGFSSVFHVFLNVDGVAIDQRRFDASDLAPEQLLKQDANQVRLLRLALNAGGTDLAPWPGGMCSTAHRSDHLERTVKAFDHAIHLLRPR